MKIIGALLALAAAALSATQQNGSSAKLAADPITIDTTSSRGVVTQVAMRNVSFYVTSSAALRIRSLRGEMRSLRGGPIVFDDKNSFAIRISSAEVGLNGSDLSNLLNDVVFAYPGAPLKFERTPWQIRLPAPTLGQHNEEIFGARLGLKPGRIEELRRIGVI